ncbi:HNH endonuclease, partial [Arthrospira platensis SPKY1]|nr:HNH endonuclease [Arthrospira platensis SPKY1]
SVVHGEWPATSLDHIDHDTRNNRIENLRLAPPAVNGRNLSKYRNNTSGRTGITQVVSGRFQVRIGYKGRRIALGTYDTFEEAEAVHEAVLRALGFHPNHGT